MNPKSANKPDPKPPAHLRPTTARWWCSVVADFELEAHHLRLLTLACQAWDRGEQAREVIAKEGLTFKDFRGQPKARPEVAIERDSRLSFARLVRELGLDLGEDPSQSRPPRVRGQR